MLTIKVSVAEKRCTTSQYENVFVGADIEATHLEGLSPEDVQRRTHEMFQLARGAVQRQLLEMTPEANPAQNGNANGHAPSNGFNGNGQNGNGANAQNGNGSNGNGQSGNGRSYGRPQPEPTPKQRVLLARVARERNLTAEQVGEIARREFGKDVPRLDRHEMSQLLEHLMSQEART